MTAPGGSSAEGVVVVTGASGMLGRHVCADLSRRGCEVRALVRDPASFTDAPPGVTVGRCDLPETIDEALLEGASALVHCAYATRVTDLAEARRVNEDGTRRMLEASRRAGIPRFVFISTVAANPHAPNYYARSKHRLESLLDPQRDLVVRAGLILAREGHGIFQQMRDTTRRTHLVPLFGGGKQPLQTVHVDDLCEALARALTRGLTGAVNVAEPEPVSMATFMRMLSNRLEVRCLFLPLPFGPVLAALRVIEALRLPFPLRSESLLAIKGVQQLPVEEDLRRLDLTVRTAEQSLAGEGRSCLTA
jgi:nucleoside-diphosphate-sugar epimerase